MADRLSEQVAVRLTPHMRSELELAAKIEERSIGSILRRKAFGAQTERMNASADTEALEATAAILDAA